MQRWHDDLRQQGEYRFYEGDTMRRPTEQALFFHFDNTRLAELGRIAEQLQKEGWTVVFLAAKRKDEPGQVKQ